MIIVIDGRKIMEQARKLAELENKTQCPTLFKFAIQNGITLQELRDEIRLLISMPDDELKEISQQMKS